MHFVRFQPSMFYGLLALMSTGILFITCYLGNITHETYTMCSPRQRVQTKSTGISDQNIYTKVYSITWIKRPNDTPKNLLTFKFRNCEFRNCKIGIASDETSLGKSDAVLFYHTSLDSKVPNKSSNQKWVFISIESETYTNKNFLKKEWVNQFDWVFSYRPDADISYPYGELARTKIQTEKNYTRIFLQKSKNVAWVVSHCTALSKRNEYIQEMKKNIEFDVFGKCGKKCGSQPFNWNDDSCLKDLSEVYKFYLSFENTLCEDYVTEKAFRFYQDGFDIIPVYRGALNIRNILPKGTFISTLDFLSPKELALHLKHVGSDESLYTSYLKAKDHFVSSSWSQQEMLQSLHCSVCAKLNTGYKRSTKLNLTHWILEKKCLIPTDI
ncbi:4-galactosyl-N-acetylglucosaminide 3-alpha-L-fucosyltransferase 9-like [Mytilus edulis]|uniref:4-galactosyl-N-acetylglucosaminide 3-alpha-L-fucosyltransferase 9-like n=1 Tax=Mytilus edulis TaxID=6550 RepID=UPI0039EF4531